MCDYVMRPARRQRTDGGGGCGGGNMEIPNDLLICEVLTRLPVKSLLRFRSVCRSWRDAVADPAFVRRHLELSRAATPPSTTVLAVHTRMDHDPDDRAAPEDVVSFHRVRPGQSPAAAAAAIVELMHEEAMECAGIHLFASHCDGLVAVAATAGKIFVCNPATKEFFLLPPGGRNGPSKETAALGFDPCTGRYVVARCFFRRDVYYRDEDTGVLQYLEYDINDIVHQVFVLGPSGSGDWEATVTPPCIIYTNLPAACAGGAFYWVAHDKSDGTFAVECPNCLVRFAMNDGTFTIVPLPQCVTFMDVDFDSISELGGELCYTQRTSGTAYNIWTLQLPGDEEEEGHRWSLRWRVDFRRRVGVVLPLAVSDDGGTLTVYEHRVGIHRLDGGRESHPEKVVDMAAVTRGLVGQWIAGYGCARQCGGSGDHDREQCDGGGAAHDRMQCGDGDYYCERCGGDGDYCERCGADDEDDWEQCGGDDGDGDGDGDGVGEPLGLGQGDHGDHDGDEYDDGYDYDGEEEYWYLQGGRYKPLRPALRSLFAYVPSLVKID